MTDWPHTARAFARLRVSINGLTAEFQQRWAIRRRLRALRLIERSVRLDPGALHQITSRTYDRAVNDTVEALKQAGRLA